MDGDEGAHGVPGGAGGADGCRRVQTGAGRGAHEGCRKGMEVQLACMDLLILLECIGPCPNALRHVLPQCGSQTGRGGGAAHCGQEAWHKGSREAVGRRERDAAATVAGKTREQVKQLPRNHRVSAYLKGGLWVLTRRFAFRAHTAYVQFLA